MIRIKWEKGSTWTKLVINRTHHISVQRITDLRAWCDTFDGPNGRYALWVCNYDGYAVLRFEDPHQALAFRMRWM